MATIDITFQQMSFPSMQIGDVTYYISTDESGGFTTANENNLTEIWIITNIAVSTVDNTTTITCDIPDNATPPAITDFILFAKDNRINVSSLVGYYGSVKFQNDSTGRAEMFSAACEISESSK